MNKREDLIARLCDAKKDELSIGECWNLMDEAADMLEADAQAAPQEPVLYKYEHIYGYLSDQYSTTQWKPTWVDKWLETKLYAAPNPQRPRLTDEEIDAIPFNGYTNLRQRFESENECLRAFARAIEAKVRGEA